MPSKQKRAIVIVSKKPNWHYWLFAKRFSKGWDVYINPTVGTFDMVRPTYEHVTLIGDDTIRHISKSLALKTHAQYRVKESPFKMRTYQEAWAHLTYDVFKELGHEDGEGYMAGWTKREGGRFKYRPKVGALRGVVKEK